MNMKTTTITYASLFVIAMIGAYMTWTKAPEEVTEDKGIVLINAKPDGLTSITYETKDIDVKVENKKDEFGAYVWVSTTRKVDKKKPQNPHDPKAATDPDTQKIEEKGEVEVQKSAFKAGEAGKKLVEELAPFRVTRKLEVAESDLATFGFDEPSGKLTVEAGGKTHSYDIGDTAYGHKHVYMRDSDTGAVYVVKRSIVGPLERADTRLPEKELFAGAITDITKVSVASPAGSMELLHRNREDLSKASWTTPDSNTANVSAGSWLEKVFRLRSAGYVPVSFKPQTEPVFSVKLEFDDGKPVQIEVVRGANDKGEETWYARSEFTRSMVKLNGSIAADAAADIATLFTSE